MKLRRLVRPLLLAVVLAGGFVYFTSLRHLGRNRELPWELGSATSKVTLAQSDTSGLSPDEANNIQIYKSASPAVVNVTSIALTYDFFLNPVPTEGAGSGFIIDPDGDVVTNFHVISGAREVKVTTADHKTYGAKVMGADQRTDLAVLRINAGRKLPYLPLGDSSRLQVGQKVLAIGNPFGRFQNTLTTGVISSLDRQVRDPSGNIREDMIQTDAAINQGNSGGPLLNSRGEVIGVNTLIVGPAYLGIGFAIPINQVKLVAGDLIREGRVARPWLGASLLSLTPDLAEYLQLGVEGGVLILSLVPKGPAELAGLRGGRELVIIGNLQLPVGGDVLVAIDGKPARSREEVARTIEGHRPGETVKISVYRARQRLEIPVKLEARPAQR